MKKGAIPSRETLEKHAQVIPEIEPSSVLAMLQVLQVSAEIQHAIIEVLEKEHQLSEGKLHVMIILHQEVDGIAPSELAEKVGVTRATVSVMLRRMIRDGLAYSFSDAVDGRAKKICLTVKGRQFMNEVLPAHYLRITKLMGKLSEQEQEDLISLLKKILHDS